MATQPQGVRRKAVDLSVMFGSLAIGESFRVAGGTANTYTKTEAGRAKHNGQSYRFDRMLRVMRVVTSG